MNRNQPIIAIVDDDKIFQLTASKSIQSISVSEKILQFENGEDALKFIRQHQHDYTELPDIIFLDINMPLMDGWMFLDDFQNIKSNLAKPVKVFMVSSSIDPRDIERARRNDNVSDYVVKPVSREKFSDLLRMSNQ